jgi:hypothetical protein
MNCIFLVVGMQVKFLKYETGPDTLVKGTSVCLVSSPLCADLYHLRCDHIATEAVGYDVTQMGTFRPKVDPATLEFVMYERVIRDPHWWRKLLKPGDEVYELCEDCGQWEPAKWWHGSSDSTDRCE